MEVKINREIRNYTESMYFGLSMRQFFFSVLAVIVAVWLVGGIGLAGCGIEVFSTPLWIIGGTIGPWIAAIVCAVALARCVFADFNLDDDAEVVAGAATAGATDAEGEEARRG